MLETNPSLFERVFNPDPTQSTSDMIDSLLGSLASLPRFIGVDMASPDKSDVLGLSLVSNVTGYKDSWRINIGSIVDPDKRAIVEDAAKELGEVISKRLGELEEKRKREKEIRKYGNSVIAWKSLCASYVAQHVPSMQPHYDGEIEQRTAKAAKDAEAIYCQLNPPPVNPCPATDEVPALDEEQKKGFQAAVLLAEHLHRMRANNVQIPVTVNAEGFLVTATLTVSGTRNTTLLPYEKVDREPHPRESKPAPGSESEA